MFRNDEKYGKDVWKLPKNYNHYYLRVKVIDKLPAKEGDFGLVIEN